MYFVLKWMRMNIRIILLGIVFYKYLSDSFLIRVYDLINDEKAGIAQRWHLEAYKE